MQLLKKATSDNLKWLNNEYNRKNFRDKPPHDLEEIKNGGVCLDNIVRLARALDFHTRWGKALFLDSLNTRQGIEAHASQVVDGEFYALKVLIDVNEYHGGSVWITRRELYPPFLLLLSLGRFEQGNWLGRKIFEADSPDRFLSRSTTRESSKEGTEWQPLVDGEEGALYFRVHQLIPSQSASEASSDTSTEDEPNFPYWVDKPLCGLVLRLWLVMNGHIPPQSIPQGIPGCGVYENLFQNWDNPEGLAAAIRDACDYHLERTRENPKIRYDVAEFSLKPYNVLPVEIFALRFIRERLGLPTPLPSHPLLDSAFSVNFPRQVPASSDPLLLAFCEAAEQVLPNLRRF